MPDIEEVIQFIIDALSANAAKGQGSVVTIRVAPYRKPKNAKTEQTTKIITNDDVLDAHEALKDFDGDFKKLFSSKK